MSQGLLAGSDEGGRGFRRIVWLLISLVIVPTGLLSAVAIFMLVSRETNLNLLYGVLVMTMVGCLVTGGVLSLVFLRREAKLSRLQLDFVSKVSHELRTPLTSIRMFVDMLQETRERQDAEEMAVCLDVLQKETARLTERIERLLDWGRMESGRRVYEMREESGQAVVDATVDAFEAANIGRHVPLQIEVEEGVQLIVDRPALVDALLNLLSNAVKYTDGDDKHIELRLWTDQRHVRIAVKDKGIGIPVTEHADIFQKFYRSDELLSREVEGTGLGLAIVRHVVQAHNGRVELDSTPGEGSTFTILIPRPRADQLAAATATAGALEAAE